MAIPRGAAPESALGTVGSPAPFEKQIVTGTVPPWRWAARLIERFALIQLIAYRDGTWSEGGKW
jgi:hypothetical protein